MEPLSAALATFLETFLETRAMATTEFGRHTSTVASGQPRPDVLTARPFARTVITLQANVRLHAIELGHLKTSLIHLCHLKIRWGTLAPREPDLAALEWTDKRPLSHESSARRNFVGSLGFIRQLSKSGTLEKICNRIKATSCLFRPTLA